MEPRRRAGRARDLPDLAMAAIDDIEACRDFDWFICWQVRLWEIGHEQAYADDGLQLVYGKFDYHRWADICYLVRNRIFRYIFSKLHTRTDPLTTREYSEFCETLKNTTKSVCEDQFRKLCDELDELDLDVYG